MTFEVGDTVYYFGYQTSAYEGFTVEPVSCGIVTEIDDLGRLWADKWYLAHPPFRTYEEAAAVRNKEVEDFLAGYRKQLDDYIKEGR